MATSQLTPVSFHGDNLYLTTYKNEPYTPMKPIVENMGLSWSPQRRKLTDNRERWGVIIMIIPTQSGEQEMLCMPVRKLPAFFGTIQPNRVKKEIRGRIILYQNECDDVLWEYWSGQQVRQRPALSRLSTRQDPERKELTAMINSWVGVAPIHYAGARSVVNAHIGVKKVDEMTINQVKEAIKFVQDKINEATSMSSVALPDPSTDYEKSIKDRQHELATHIFQLGDLMRQYYNLVRSESDKVMRHPQKDTRKRRIFGNAIKSMDCAFNSIEENVGSIEHHARMIKDIVELDI